MQTASDWLKLLGVFLIFGGVIYFIYLWLPRLRPTRAAEPERAPARTLNDWSRLADAQEGYGPGHARRVADLALALAEAIALPQALRGPLEQAALLHDIGEVDFEPELLGRVGLLTQAELFRLWQHPVRGARLAHQVSGNPVVGHWVRWHHERWDGLGYPDGLTGREIPLPARILRLADSAEAMLHARPYRAAFAGDDVIAEINRLAGVSYDPELARLFVDYVFPRYLAERDASRG